MKLSIQSLIVPIIAVVVFLLTLQQTLGALRDSGAWRTRPRFPQVTVEDPYTRVDELFAQNPEPPTDGMRNPFAFGAARTVPVVNHGHTIIRPPVIPPPPPKPALTSIIWDSDPRATIRYDGRDFSVRVNSLFADFRVKSITANQVILDRNGESIVLALRPKGE